MTLRKLRVNVLRLAFLPIVFVGLFVRPSWALESTMAFLVELGGFVFLLAGLTVRIWCTFYIGGRKSKELITTGPFSICRNPLYAGTFLLAFGIGLCFENMLMLLLVLVVIIPTHVLVVRLEEGHLEGVFGEEYRLYKESTPRFLPRIRNYRSPDTVSVSVHAIRRIAMDTIAVLLLPEIEDLLEVLHAHGILPVLWHFPPA
ncbi:MAG: isoprenylcysteine carboxylmethyltransferase family protein [Sedimentisphaerales bacterium]|nr:isoprenylcysteine carboxylmethyltransferase family protein [Sedimentisphaerales bacterium]